MSWLRRAVLLLLPVLAAGPALAQGDPSFTLVNRSGQAIRTIHVSPSSDDYWGRDLLAPKSLPNGRSLPIRIAPSAGCEQDVRVVYQDGRAEERLRQNTCAISQMVFGATGAAPDRGSASDNPSFNLVNHGRQLILQAFVSSSRDTHWGENRLGADALPPGRHLAVRLPQGDCMNDVMVIWQDGRREERRALNTCQEINLVFR